MKAIKLLLLLGTPGSLALLTPASAQTPLSLSIKMNAGQPQLTVTGAVGTTCQVQWTDTLSVTGGWFHLGFLVLASPPSPLTDSSSSSATRRYYRAVWTPNTNFVWISPGMFTMGSPPNEAERFTDEARHIVTISRGFWMEKYLVDQGDYLAVVGSNPSFFQDDTNLPVESVSWFDATNYCALRTQQERDAGLIPTNYVYRLPTESEWEYADRAGTTTAFYLGSDLHSEDANFDGRYEYDASVGQINNTNGIYLGQTTPVGKYAPNPWGLYDMIGNVSEWCQDWYGTYPAGSVIDPQGPDTGTYRVIRGGVWNYGAKDCRSAFRNGFVPDGSDFDDGFRAVLAPEQP